MHSIPTIDTDAFPKVNEARPPDVIGLRASWAYTSCNFVQYTTLRRQKQAVVLTKFLFCEILFAIDLDDGIGNREGGEGTFHPVDTAQYAG